MSSAIIAPRRSLRAWRYPVLLLIIFLLGGALLIMNRLRPVPAAVVPTPTLPDLSTLERCTQHANVSERVACYRPVLEAHLSARGPRAVLADLDELQARTVAFAGHCHDMAHVLGRFWVAQGETVAKGFAEGSNVCHSGFFHGMVERMLEDDRGSGEPRHASPDELRAKIPGVCTPASLGSESQNIRFQCLHGLGHAVAFTLGYRLPLALETCEVLSGSWEQSACYGGAFMENINGIDQERRMVRAGDAHFPCSDVAERTRDACYRMQTSWMIEDNMTWNAIIAACREAGPHTLACFESLGRDLSPLVRAGAPDAVASICFDLPSEERSACIRGATSALADHTWDGRSAYPFCAVADTPELRAECFLAAHRQLLDALEQSPEPLAAQCQKYARGNPECLETLRVVRESAAP